MAVFCWQSWKEASPHVGTVFHRPQVVEAAREAIEAKNYQARCKAVGGDFFQAVPSGGDLATLKFILVDWKDADALRILQNCRRAITPDGKLVVIEMTIPDAKGPSPGQSFDSHLTIMERAIRRRSPPTLTETVTDHMRGVVKPSGP